MLERQPSETSSPRSGAGRSSSGGSGAVLHRDARSSSRRRRTESAEPEALHGAASPTLRDGVSTLHVSMRMGSTAGLLHACSRPFSGRRGNHLDSCWSRPRSLIYVVGRRFFTALRGTDAGEGRRGRSRSVSITAALATDCGRDDDAGIRWGFARDLLSSPQSEFVVEHVASAPPG